MTKDDHRPPKRTDDEDRKPYATPSLTKRAVLSDVTAKPAGSRAPEPSDIRLKRDIRPVGRTEEGLTLYRFRYLWSEVEMVGVMAQEVLDVAPEAVILAADGYYRVDYGRLGIRFTTYEEWCNDGRLADAA